MATVVFMHQLEQEVKAGQATQSRDPQKHQFHSALCSHPGAPHGSFGFLAPAK